LPNNDGIILSKAAATGHSAVAFPWKTPPESILKPAISGARNAVISLDVRHFRFAYPVDAKNVLANGPDFSDPPAPLEF
jgi:hypothetical protein